ncbi:hypothetical protein RRG08_018062 [Elysia crispata]|uniref:Uncharacterized protein n=1 Tax=Elysia crispata TaxID=231223 RepID=A0AAE1DE61_9GAST|nr:hypothetical protein RRG08_018062 [Elysia crispata]
MSFCPGEHAWPNISRATCDTQKDAVTDPCCRDKIKDRDGKSTRLEKPRNSSGERAPQGVEQLTGRVSPYNSSGAATRTIKQSSKKEIIRTKVDPCKPQSAKRAPPECMDVVLPNPINRRSFDPWNGGPSKPCYRKKTTLGVYVGVQPFPETHPLDEETTRPWDNDTWIPYGGIFLQYNP